jgi:hypothetical protein
MTNSDNPPAADYDQLLADQYRGRHKEIGKLAVGESWIAQVGCGLVGRARRVSHKKHGYTIRNAVNQYVRMLGPFTGVKFKCETLPAGAIKVTRIS